MAANKWLIHMKKFWAKHKGKMSYKRALQEGKKTYNRKGGKKVKFKQDQDEYSEDHIKKVGESIEKRFKGGKIDKKVKKREKKIDPKIEEAIDKTFAGGKIDKVKKREKKKDAKVEEAINTTFTGGKIKKKFHNRLHKHLHENLTGKGGRFDSPFVRKKMHELMTKHGHPKIFQSYITGRYNNFHEDPSDTLHGPPKPVRRDSIAHVIDTGGSLKKLTHSEGGFLQSYDSKWYSHVEIV